MRRAPTGGPGATRTRVPSGAFLVSVLMVLWSVIVLLLGLVGLLLFGGDPPPVLPAWSMATMTAAQMMMMAGAGALAWRLTRRVCFGDRAPVPWLAGEARWTPTPVGLAMLVGASMGWLPGWLSTQLQQRWPDLGGASVEMIVSGLTEGWWPWRVIMVICIVVGAPVVEEFVFRGVLWEGLSQSLSRRATWAITSLMFAGYHIDPVQAVPLIFSAGVLGWVRLATGSLGLCMVAHAANNFVGTVLVLQGWESADTGLAGAVLMTLVCMLACGGLWLASREERA